MTYKIPRPDFFYSEVSIPNLKQIQEDFIDLFGKLFNTNVPSTWGFLIIDSNIKLPNSLTELKHAYNLGHKGNSVNFSVINNGERFGGVHCDATVGLEKYLALNIPLLNCDGSYISWYSGEPTEQAKTNLYNESATIIAPPRGATKHDTTQEIDAGTAMWVGPEHNLIKLNTVECLNPMLVHVGRPHQPSITHKKLRVMLSIRFFPELTEEEFLTLTTGRSAGINCSLA